MGETGLVLPKAENWQLRGTLLIIGIATWVFGIILIIAYTYAFFTDLSDFYEDGSMYQATGRGDYIVTVLDMAIDGGFLGMCDFDILPPSKPGNATNKTKKVRPPVMSAKQKALAKKLAKQAEKDSGASVSGDDDAVADDAPAAPLPDDILVPPTTEPIPVQVNQNGCKKSVDKETRWQRAELNKDSWRIFTKAEGPIQKVFIFLDVLMIIFGFLSGIIGYLLVHGTVWKRRKLLLPWLLMSFTIAYGAALYSVMHMAMRTAFSPEKMLLVGAVAAATVIVIVLHAAAFYAVAKYCAHLWKRESTPQYPIRRMGLVLART